MYSRHVNLTKLQLATCDALSVALAMLLAAWLRHRLAIGDLVPPLASPVPWADWATTGLIMAPIVALLLRSRGLYALRLPFVEQTFRITKATTLATMVLLTVAFFVRPDWQSRATVALFYPLCIGMLVGARALFDGYVRLALRDRRALRRAAIVGTGDIAQLLAGALRQRPFYYELVGFVSEAATQVPRSLGGIPVLGTSSDLTDIVREHSIDEVLLANTGEPVDVMNLIGECLSVGVRWKAVPYLFDLKLKRIEFDSMEDIPLVTLRGTHTVGLDWALKRAFDVAFASVALLFLAPLMLLIGSLIKLSSPGPILFRQTRAGLNGSPFEFLKFRSMRVGADAALHRAYTREWIYGRTGDVPNGDAAAHKIQHDPRVTAIGRFLRKTSLDELPQFINVLRGEMSVVGPRPAIPYEVERYSEWHKARLKVLPGITGLWQVSGRNSLSFEDMVRLDIDYIERWSLGLDFAIVLRTVPALLFQRAY